MSGTAILCSGQGRQSVDMFDLVASAKTAEPVFAAAARVLGSDPRTFVKSADQDKIDANRAGQILCCTRALAAWASLADLVPRPLLVAGYSVGELAAWGVAGLIEAEKVIALAAERATAMDGAQRDACGLLAVRGLPLAKLEAICASHAAHVAIRNAADRHIVGGFSAALDAVADEATAQGAEKTQLLPVHVASHTPLLAAAVGPFRNALTRASVANAMPESIRLISGIDGAPVFDISQGLDKLARQLCEPVDWAACMETVAAFGPDLVLELGPGDALAHMTRNDLPGASVQAADGFRTLAGLRAWLAKRYGEHL